MTLSVFGVGSRD